VSGAPDAGPAIVLVSAAAAPAGSGDPTRRWALAFPDGAVRFPGIARTEAEGVIPALSRTAPADWDLCLVEVGLPVLLSEGAGPYMLDAAGRITLALGPHPALAGQRVAMGEPAPGHRIGLVGRVEGRLWRWSVEAEVAPQRRADALGRLDAAPDAEAARRWQDEARRDGG
jgi:hypothetical protein